MSIKQKIFEKLDKDGYCTDQDTADIYGKEPNWTTAEEYKRQWHRLQADKAFFKGHIIVKKEKHRKGHYVQLKNAEEDTWFSVGKDYYKEITI